MSLSSAVDFSSTFQNYTCQAFGGQEEKEKFLAAFDIQMVPFLFRDYEHMQLVLDTYLTPVIIPIAEKLGLKIAGWAYHGTRVLEATYDRPIMRPEDIQKGELRVPEGEAWNKVGRCLVKSRDFKAVPHSEVKTSIKKKAIHVIEFPLPSIKVLELDSDFKQIILTNHLVHFLYWVFSAEKLKEMSSDQKVVFFEAVKEAIKYNDKERIKEEQECLRFYQKNLKVTVPDKDAFRKQTKEQFEEKVSSPIFQNLYKAVIMLR